MSTLATREVSNTDAEPNSTGVRTLDYERLDADLIVWLARREARRAAGRHRRPRRRVVYERDSWTCALCLGPVDRRLNPPHPHAATLDHRTPRAHGGPTTPENLQTAHAICNHVRGDLPLTAVDPALFAEIFAEAARWSAALASGAPEANIMRARRRWFRRVRRIRHALLRKAGASDSFRASSGRTKTAFSTSRRGGQSIQIVRPPILALAVAAA